MKQCILLVSSFFIIAGCDSGKTISYSQKDLQKIHWIEGNWQGMDGQDPFYEIYQFVNDSTIEITSYEWNGRDSIHSSKKFLLWKNNQYYLGNDLNYNVTEITDSSISMDPNNKAGNSILWKTKDVNTWIAILRAKNMEKKYTMKRINHFSK